jgi:hypothetical protein
MQHQRPRTAVRADQPLPRLTCNNTRSVGSPLPRLLIDQLLLPDVALSEIDEHVVRTEESDLPQVARRRFAVKVWLFLWHPGHTRCPPAFGKVGGRKDLEWGFLPRRGENGFPVDLLDWMVVRRVGEDDRDHHERDDDQCERADHVARRRLPSGTRHVPIFTERANLDRPTLARRPWERLRTLAESWTLFLMESVETIARHDGPRGEVVLRRRLAADLTVEELIINGAFAMDSSESSTESLLAELALTSGRAQRVLVGGLGLGYTVAAILAKDVDLIDVVEIEQCLIDWANQGMTATLAAVASDPRVRLHTADVQLVLEGLGDGPVGQWDAIVLDVDNGPEFLIHAGNRALYTEAGLRAAYAQLAIAGTLAIWCQGPAPPLRGVLERIAPSVREHVVDVTRGERSFPYAIYTVSKADGLPPNG